MGGYGVEEVAINRSTKKGQGRLVVNNISEGI
jgi:hypothetical protein